MAISNALLGKARRMLRRDVLEIVERRPTERLPKSIWRRLSRAEQAVVVELQRAARDDYHPKRESPPATRTHGEGARAHNFVGADPIAGHPLDAVTGFASDEAQPQPDGVTGLSSPEPSRPDPVTGLDPLAMRELFGSVADTQGLEKFSGQALLDELRERFFFKHVHLSYEDARQAMMSFVDNQGGDVRDVYTGRVLHGVKSLQDTYGETGFNTEHTWPQSDLRNHGDRIAISDLHHLFPADSEANGQRANYPFGWVKTPIWSSKNGASRLGYDANHQVVFMPPPEHRGDVARALFWIAAAYNLKIPSDEEQVLKEWDKADPSSPEEKQRNLRIKQVQGDLNPFVIDSTLIDRIPDV